MKSSYNKQILSPAKSAGCDVNLLRGLPRLIWALYAMLNNVKNLKFKKFIIPLVGILISVFPSLVVLPMEAFFGEGDHFSLGHVLAAFILMICCVYSIILTLSNIGKDLFLDAAVQFILGFIQITLILNNIGYF